PPQAKDMLAECLAMGADEAILLSDRALGGSDTWATSNALAAGIKKIGGFDLIFAGRQAIDGDTAQVGPQIAEKLGLPQVTYVKEFRLEDGRVIVKRALEDGYERLKAPLPCVLTAIKELNEPRYMSVPGILRAAKAEVKVWSAEDIGVDKTTVGLKASPTNVFRSFTPKPKGKGIAVEGDTPKELAANLLADMKHKHII
ncbi:electron transfer flavoprotein subunit beta/FixA family protein, partial [Anaerovorax odorimutans]